MGKFDRYMMKGGKQLRCGYTTGSCAAAAAKGAAALLLTGKIPSALQLETPAGIFLALEPRNAKTDGLTASCEVIKDAGDDPDVTDGILIGCRVRKTTGEYLVRGGEGVGVVTKPGLKCPLGEAAINPIPREMILKELRRVGESCGYQGGLSAEIYVPMGKSIASHTYNPKLGIEGGISILGTSGIVEPMSEQALLDTIEAELSILRAENKKFALVTPGNYGSDFSRENLGLNLDQSVKCGNFIGDTLDLACGMGFSGVLLLGHAGKLIKLAAGIMNTHSHTADGRMEILASHAALCGGSRELVAGLMSCVVTDAAFDLLQKEGLLEPVMGSVMEKVEIHLQERAPDILTGALVFSKFGIWETQKVQELLLKYREETE